MNSTAITPSENASDVIYFLIGCVTVLVILLIVLFAGIPRASCCFAWLKYIKIKAIKVFKCCIRRDRQKEVLNENLNELKEIL